MGANIPGKPRVFLPNLDFVGPYRAKCDAIAANDYEGFAFDAAPWKGPPRDREPVLHPRVPRRLRADQRRARSTSRRAARSRTASSRWRPAASSTRPRTTRSSISTWYSGTHQIWRDVYIGPDHALDPTKYFIVVDQPDRQRALDLAAQRRRGQRRPGHVEVPARSASATTSSPRSGCCASTSASSGSRWSSAARWAPSRPTSGPCASRTRSCGPRRSPAPRRTPRTTSCSPRHSASAIMVRPRLERRRVHVQRRRRRRPQAPRPPLGGHGLLDRVLEAGGLAGAGVRVEGRRSSTSSWSPTSRSWTPTTC